MNLKIFAFLREFKCIEKNFEVCLRSEYRNPLDNGGGDKIRVIFIYDFVSTTHTLFLLWVTLEGRTQLRSHPGGWEREVGLSISETLEGRIQLRFHPEEWERGVNSFFSMYSVSLWQISFFLRVLCASVANILVTPAAK